MGEQPPRHAAARFGDAPQTLIVLTTVSTARRQAPVVGEAACSGEPLDTADATIQEVLLDLAGQVGTQEDLEWIGPRVLKNGTSDSAWSAFRMICQRQSADVNMVWVRWLMDQHAPSDRIRQLLELSEQKAQTENNTALLEEIWLQLLKIYRENNDYQQILEVGKRIRESSANSGIIAAAHPYLLKAALNTQQWDQVALTFDESLEKVDLDPVNPLVIMVDEYLRSGDISEDLKKSLLNRLIKTKVNPNRPKWNEIVTLWQKQILPVQEVTPAPVKQPSN